MNYAKYQKKRAKLEKRAKIQSAKSKGVSVRVNFYNSAEWKQARYEALANNDGRCELCGRGKHDGVKLHVDHIVPLSIDPLLALTLSNLQVLCEDCNLGKSNKCDRDWRKPKPENSLATAALRLLLEKSDLHKLYSKALVCIDEDLDRYKDTQFFKCYGAGTLLRVCEVLDKRPEMTKAMILGHFYGTSDGVMLNSVEKSPNLHLATDIERQFEDILFAMTEGKLLQTRRAENGRIKINPLDRL